MLTSALLLACVWWVVPRSRALAVGVTVLLLVPGAAVVNLAYLSTIPSYFLIEPDTAPDASVWQEACDVEGFSLDPVRQGISRGLERRGETWVRRDNGKEYGILRVPGCAVEPIAIPELPIAPGLHQALPDGSVVYVTMERGTAGQQFWLLKRGSNEPSRLQVPAGQPDHVPLVIERPLERAGAAEPLAPLEHEHAAARPGQVRRRGEAVVAAPDDDCVPVPPGELGHRLGQADLAQARRDLVRRRRAVAAHAGTAWPSRSASV